MRIYKVHAQDREGHIIVERFFYSLENAKQDLIKQQESLLKSAENFDITIYSYPVIDYRGN